MRNTMEHYSERLITYKRRSEIDISASCIVLCLIFLLVLGFLPVLSAGLTRFFRPAFILISLLGLRSGIYKFGAEKWMILNLIYYIAIFFAFPITSNSFETVVSMELFGLFFILAAARPWNRREIKLFLQTVVFASVICATVLLYSNPNLLHSGGVDRLRFLSGDLNRNTFAFSLVPGALCATLFILYRRNRFERAICFAMCVLCAYTVFAIGCRSAFYSLVIGMFLILWQKSRDVTSSKSRAFIKISIILAFFLILIIITIVSKGTYSERLFNVSSGSGRERIWEQAWSLVQQKPWFGGGYDYWIDNGIELGTHNTFLLIMLYSGYVGGALLAMFLIAVLLEIFKGYNLIPLSFVAELLCHIYSETSMDYYAYIPLILSFVILRYILHQKKGIDTIFS